MRLHGRASTFGGPSDSQDNNRPASGIPNEAGPGIALMNHHTLGGWWRLRAPNGKTLVVRQNEIGPAGWTGRTFDLNPHAVHAFGYSVKDFPTDQGTWHAQYLGKRQPASGTSTPPRQRSAVPTATLGHMLTAALQAPVQPQALGGSLAQQLRARRVSLLG